MTPELRDLDRAIAEARGETVYWEQCPQPTFCPCDGWMWKHRDGGSPLPKFSTDPGWTLRLLEEMATQGSSIEPTIGRWQDTWRVEFYSGYLRIFSAPTLPEAVARAWLAWHEATKSPAG